MNTFLIKTLGAVNNPNLPKINEIRFPMNLNCDYSTRHALELRWTAAASFRTSAVDIYAAATGDQTLEQPVTALAAVTRYPYFNRADGYVFLSEPSSLERLDNSDSGILTIDLEFASRCPSLKRFNGGGVHLDSNTNSAAFGDIGNFVNAENMDVFQANGMRVYGDMSIFENNSQLTTFIAWKSQIEGSFSMLGHCTGLTRLASTSGQITPDYQDMCDAMFANGRTSGQLRIQSDVVGEFYVQFTPSGWSVVE